MSPAKDTEPARSRLRAAEHLKRTGDFRHVYRNGNRARGEWMTVAACENGLDRTRLGLSVGRVAWRRAVRRNRVRRIFREAFRLERAALPNGVDLVLIAVPGSAPDLDSARQELVKLANKAWRRYRRKIEERGREASET